jgi:hypothetical protein
MVQSFSNVRQVNVRATRSTNRNLAQRLNPNVQQDALANITGNRNRVLGRLETGADASPFTADADLATTAQQLLDPTLTAQQAGLAQTTRRSIAARGLTGGAVDAAVGAQQNSFLAGNRIEALQTLSGAISGRVGQLSENLDPFYNLVGGSVTDLFNQPGSQVDFLKLREAIGKRALQSDVSASIFGGLEALGRGGVVQGALMEQLGADGGLQGTANTQENQELMAALMQFLDPKLSREQQGDPRHHVDPTRDFDRATNQLLAGGRLAQFFQEQIGGLNTDFADLQATARGLSSLQGTDQQGAHQKILEQDFSRFRNLLSATGIISAETPDPNAARNLVDSTSRGQFVQNARDMQTQFSAPVRQLGVGGRVLRTRVRKVAI